MFNFIGTVPPTPEVLRHPAAHLHTYGKGSRPGRKVGHVTLRAASADPRSILDWEPLARTARQLYAEEFAQLDGALGSTFPFSAERIQNAHARWTAEWLAWERTHDAEYKLKAAAAEEELTRSAGSTVARARLDAVEREKLELYQRRYEEYIRVAKGLQALIS